MKKTLTLLLATVVLLLAGCGRTSIEECKEEVRTFCSSAATLGFLVFMEALPSDADQCREVLVRRAKKTFANYEDDPVAQTLVDVAAETCKVLLNKEAKGDKSREILNKCATLLRQRIGDTILQGQPDGAALERLKELSL